MDKNRKTDRQINAQSYKQTWKYNDRPTNCQKHKQTKKPKSVRQKNNQTNKQTNRPIGAQETRHKVKKSDIIFFFSLLSKIVLQFIGQHPNFRSNWTNLVLQTLKVLTKHSNYSYYLFLNFLVLFLYFFSNANNILFHFLLFEQFSFRNFLFAQKSKNVFELVKSFGIIWKFMELKGVEHVVLSLKQKKKFRKNAFVFTETSTY